MHDAPALAPYLLAAFEGARPPAPAWFVHAIAQSPERSRVEVEGAQVEVLAWGPAGGQGLLFLHGAGAHAGWWSFVAPFFAAQGRRVAALSWSGMGGSGWRPRYGFDTWAAEALAAADHAGLFAHAARPDLAAHSFGGAIACHLAAGAQGARFGRVVIADAAVRPPDRRWTVPPWAPRPHRPYPTQAAALARFRLAPPQDCANAYAADHIARGGLRQTAEGWCWSFDPFVWANLDLSSRPLSQEAELAQACAPLAFLHGDRSLIVDAQALAYTRAHAPPGAPFVAVPDAAHHVMLDQPLAFVAALRALLEGWAVTPP